MLAIASLLDPVSDGQTRDLWRLLEEKCGLVGIKATPFPHFSWLSCQDLDWTRASKRLAKIAAGVKGFKVTTAGLGIFPGVNPILYLPVVKTPELQKIHYLIWKEVGKYLVNPHEYYTPEQWVPHITIAYGDLNLDNLECAIHNLAANDKVYEIFVNNISVMFQNQDGVGIQTRFELE
jgi:2'-5' RNA ligase